MLHDRFSYRGYCIQDCVIISDDMAYNDIAKYAPSLLGKSHRISDLKKSLPADLTVADCIEIRGNSISEVPHWISSLDSLKYLCIPVHLVDTLDIKYLPASLETLDISGVGKAHLRAKAVHRNIQRIRSIQTTLLFDPIAFPSLKHCEVRRGKGHDILNDLVSLELVSVMVCPFTHNSDLDKINPAKLIYLRLIGGKVTSLDGLEKMYLLTDLFLHDLPCLQDISSILRLQNIHEVSVQYCNKIVNFDVLLKLKSLSKLWIATSTNKNLTSNKEGLSNLNLKECSIGP